jgi:tetratricopeptide (TPR) repeat protein
MSDPRPKELIQAEEYYYNGNLEESLRIIRNYEGKHGITTEEQLWVLLLKGHVYGSKQEYQKVVEIGEHTFTISQELGLISEAIEALLLKVQCVLLGRNDEAFNYVLEVEKLLSTLSESPPYNYSKIVEINLLLKSWVYYFRGEFNTALNFAEEGLALVKKRKRKLFIGLFLQNIGMIYSVKGENTKAIKYGMKTIEVMRDLNFQIGIAIGFQLLSQSYLVMGNVNKALELIQESLSIETISKFGKAYSLHIQGEIYRTKGLLDYALENYKEEFKLNKEISNDLLIGASFIGIGTIYRQKGENYEGKQYFEQAILHFEELGMDTGIVLPALYLVLMNLDEKSQEQANYYLSKLQKVADQTKNQYNQQAYQLAMSHILRATSRMRDNAEAEGLLKQILEGDVINQEYHVLALISLCDLYLEELSIYNNQDVLEEINPLLIQLLGMAEAQNSFLNLAEGKLLQAKLALIQKDLEEAKLILTEAQQIAEEHGLNLLAQKISQEHDLFLEKVDEWEKLKKQGAPMAERIELASFDGVIDRLQGKRPVEPPELVDEEPILLLIMDNSGATYFNHSFATNWDYNDLFSDFLSAFNTFSSEIFSKSIDRIRIGENIILINPVEPFLACYVIKGQSYPALQKLTRFSKAIRENSEIWQALEKSVKTGEVLDLNKPPALKTVINEIF